MLGVIGKDEEIIDVEVETQEVIDVQAEAQKIVDAKLKEFCACLSFWHRFIKQNSTRGGNYE